MVAKNTSYFFYLLMFLMFSTNSFCQEKGILVTKKNDSSGAVFLKENKRIKVKLANNETFFGRFKIENDNTVSIKGNSISLDSIVKIKRKSLAFTILTPFIIYVGLGVMGIGLLVAIFNSTELGVAVFGLGTSMVVVPLISNRHPSDNWSYSISENPNNKEKK